MDRSNLLGAPGSGLPDALRLPDLHSEHQQGQVLVDALKHFDEVVRECGGASEPLMKTIGIDPNDLYFYRASATIPYSHFVALLNEAAARLRCPDFGLRLASRTTSKDLGGPLALACKHSPTIGDSLRYCSAKSYIYSDSMKFTLTKGPDHRHWLYCYDPPQSLDDQSQNIEYVLLLTYLDLRNLSGGKADPVEIWFKHKPIGSPEVYRNHFGDRVFFSRPKNALLLRPEDCSANIVDRDDNVYRLATAFIDSSYVTPGEPIRLKVERLLRNHPRLASTSTADAAAMFAMHPRTFQRRLREEGVRFDQIKDDLCREMALEYLQSTSLPLIKVASLLGYSEVSAFSRRCQHWFSCPPRQLRHAFQTRKSQPH